MLLILSVTHWTGNAMLSHLVFDYMNLSFPLSNIEAKSGKKFSFMTFQKFDVTMKVQVILFCAMYQTRT